MDDNEFVGPLVNDVLTQISSELAKKEIKDKINNTILFPIVESVINKYYYHYMTFVVLQLIIFICLICVILIFIYHIKNLNNKLKH